MWNDEDNNPYGGSFERRDSFTSSSANPSSPTTHDCRSLVLVIFLFLTSHLVHIHHHFQACSTRRACIACP